MADLQVRNGKIVYIDENGNEVYALPTQGGIPGQAVIYGEDGNLTSGIGVLTLGSLSNVDSSADSAAIGKVLSFNGAYWEAIDLSVGGIVFDSAYVQARQSYNYDLLINAPVVFDSENIQSIVDANYVTSLGVVGTDSTAVGNIITDTVNNTYVRNRQDYRYTSLTGAPTAVSAFSNDAGYLTSATVTGVIDANYIRANQNNFADSAYVALQISNLVDGAPTALDTLNELATALQNDSDALAALVTVVDTKLNTSQVVALADSAYVQARQDYSYNSLVDLPDYFDSADATILVDSDYVQLRQDYSYESLIDLPDYFDSADATILVDSDYVQLRQDNHNLTSNDSDTTISANLVPDIHNTYNLGSSTNKFATIFGGMPVYDSIGLLPNPGVPGEMGFIPSARRLYVSTGTGWFKLAIDNAAPSITSITDENNGTSPFALSANQIPSVITVEGFDSDGDFLTYSFETDTTFDTFASISQDNNVFTVTPFSQDSAPFSSSGTVTFSVSDGLGEESSIQTFTLQFVANWASVSEQARVPAPTIIGPDERIGFSVAVDGNTAVAGALGQSQGGSAYIFTRSGSTWTQQAEIQASDIEAGDAFGRSVAISGDTVVVGAIGEDTGATDAGAAYIFTRTGSTWTQQAKIQASDKEASDNFGWSVAISGDTVIVGARLEDTGGSNAGAAYIFTRSGSTWTQQAKIQASDKQASDFFGTSVAIDGDTVIVGAPGEDTGASNVGAAYIFTRSGSTWTQQAKIQASDKEQDDSFGNSVAISGDTVVVGANFEDTGGSNAGAAYIFTRSGSTWTQQQKIQASDKEAADFFGTSVAIDGATIVVGAYNEGGTGAAYIFNRGLVNWFQRPKLKASNAGSGDSFGYSVAISGNTVVIGAPNEDTGGADRGSAYIFAAAFA